MRAANWVCAHVRAHATDGFRDRTERCRPGHESLRHLQRAFSHMPISRHWGAMSTCSKLWGHGFFCSRARVVGHLRA